jgi:shikimate kinase
MTAVSDVSRQDLRRVAREAFGARNIVFVGLMGAGKSVIGKMVATALELPFVDSR